MSKGLYIHIPFCDHICSYCDFARVKYNDNKANEYIDALICEIEEKVDFSNVDTVYIGGGTPTSLSDFLLEKLLSYLANKKNNVLEMSIEINPESLTISKASILKKYGINRCSIGVQTTDDELLKYIGRKHSFNDVLECINILRKQGIDNISCDLMYSLPKQSLDILKNDLKKLNDLNIKHISIYSLTIEPNSIFGHKKYQSLDEDVEADMYEYIVKYLTDNGFEQYEIANFAKNKKYSKHNLHYWNYDDFYGTGVGAAGKNNNVRYENTRSLKKYLNGDIIEKSINNSIDETMFEHFMMSSRTIFGLDLNYFYNCYKVDFFDVYNKTYEKNKEHFMIKNNHLICVDREILNEILIDFLPN